jgi:uncharacterized protein with von Willebrand factor type A (vWA) domain
MSEYLDKMIAKAQGDDFWDDPVAASKPVTPTETHAVKFDRFDRFAYLTTLDQVPALAEQVNEAAEERDTARAGYQDLFNLLNQADPRFTEQARMKPEYVAQHAMLGQMFEDEEFSYIRSHTKLDEYNTALAMITMRDRMDDMMQAADEINEAVAQAQQALQEALAAAQAAQQSGEGQEEAAESLAQAMAAMAQAEGDAEANAEQAKEQVKKGLKDAADKIEAEQEAMQGYGVEDGTLQRMSFEERRRLAERLDRGKIKQLADLVGAFRQFADAERRRKVTGAPAERRDVTTGRDIAKLVANEINALAIPELEDQFWLRYHRHQLMQWETVGPERAGKGPIIVVCDESGSMGARVDDEGNTREAWSKAVALALCDQARRGGRDFTYIGFSSPSQQWRIDFPGGVMAIEKVIEFTEHFFSGGTQYERPIAMAANIVRDYQRGGRDLPDVVFITDDDCRVSPEFIEEWRELRESAGIRCYGLQIGGEPFRNNLKDLADRCMNINSLNASPEGVQELFRTI